MPPEMLNALPGYDPDVGKNRAEARQIMQTLGYSPDNHLKIKVTVRDIPYYRDPAVILIDQLKQVYIDGELESVDTTNFFPKMMRKDYSVGLNLQGAGDPVHPSAILWGGWNQRLAGQDVVEVAGDRGGFEVAHTVMVEDRNLAKGVALQMLGFLRLAFQDV